MTYKFDDEKVETELSTENLRHLKHCDSRVNGVNGAYLDVDAIKALTKDGRLIGGNPMTLKQRDREIVRLTAARKDIVKRLTKDEKAEYAQHLKDIAPREKTDAEKAADMKRMNENKDKPSH